MANRKYGVVYTPYKIADFVAELLYIETKSAKFPVNIVLDPACGECALLKAAKHFFGEKSRYLGIDIDTDAISTMNGEFDIKWNDTILPRNVKRQTDEYWKEQLPSISAIIANPPWSSEKIYDRGVLNEAGFSFNTGQYDSYVLFIELAYKLLIEGGYFAFIIPDSLFESQNESLRQFLTQKMQIKVIARLGEKMFEDVNRATTVLICKKKKPNNESVTRCFRLSTDDRKEFLTTNCSLMKFYKNKSHKVLQSRFSMNNAYIFDIDTRSDEEELLTKIKSDSIIWDEIFIFGRGVEISKTGKIVYCPACGFAQGYKNSQMESGEKTCTYCGSTMPVTTELVHNMVNKTSIPGSVQIFVGENVQRYSVNGEYYIQTNISGINYKNIDLYSPPKLLIRKTGLGIYGAIDYSGSMTSQTVYILKLKKKYAMDPLEYYLALLNSRVVYYYYLKAYGENEWKSHPYFTKKIVYSLPIKEYENSQLDKHIIVLAKELTQTYNYEKDVALEKLIMKKYGLTKKEQKLVIMEMNQLPNLGAVNGMKITGEINV